MLEEIDKEIEQLEQEKERLLFEKDQNNQQIKLIEELINLLQLKRKTYICNMLVIKGSIRSHKEVLERKKNIKFFNEIYKFKTSESEKSIIRLTNILEDYEVSCELLEDTIEEKSDAKWELLKRNQEIDERVQNIDKQLTPTKVYVKKGDKK